MEVLQTQSEVMDYNHYLFHSGILDGDLHKYEETKSIQKKKKTKKQKTKGTSKTPQ